jgi:lysophospholipase L1-like esterase
MLRRVATALIGSVVMVSVAGCSGSKGSSTSAASTPASSTSSSATTSSAPTSAASAALPLKKGDAYVALGSSIASGYGISKQSACGRSSRDYPQLVAARYGLKLVDVSCGAAVIPNIVDTKQGTNPPQIDAVSADTKLITISVGGNDIALNGTALGCGDPATTCTAPPDLEAKLAALPGQLTGMVDKVRAKAPSARIVFVTYPREMPVKNCPAMSLTDTELALLRSMGDRLEAAFVKAFAHSDVALVDPYVVSGDHTACAVSAPWTAGYTVKPGEGFAYHPTALGHEEMAKLIEATLGG